MKITHENIKIELNNEEEIADLYNVIMFALDYETDNKNSMTKDELEMAKKLVTILNPYHQN